MCSEVRHPESHVPGFVLRREPAHRGGDRIGRIPLEEPQQRQKRAFAEHGEQERGDREIGLVDQRLSDACPPAVDNPVAVALSRRAG